MKDFGAVREFIKDARLEKLDPNQLRPHPANDFENVAGKDWTRFVKAISDLGVIHPIICDMSGRVLSGMQRTRACRELGIKVPGYRIPNVSTETARHIVILMNLATRRMKPEEFQKYWQELYGAEVRDMVQAGARKNTIVEKIAKQSGLSAKVTARQVSTVIHESLKSKYNSIDKLDQIPHQKRSQLKVLSKRASILLSRIDELKEKYNAVRAEMREIVRIEILNLPDLQVQLHEDRVSALTGTSKLTVNKAHPHRQKFLRRTR